MLGQFIADLLQTPEGIAVLLGIIGGILVVILLIRRTKLTLEGFGPCLL